MFFGVFFCLAFGGVGLLLGGVGLVAWLPPFAPVAAAEVLQVRGPALLQLGDGNRSYVVELACLHVLPDSQQQATAWLRQQLPRHSRVNLRPLGQREGVLVGKAVAAEGAGLRFGTTLAAMAKASSRAARSQTIFMVFLAGSVDR
jgi:hypothetical protein